MPEPACSVHDPGSDRQCGARVQGDLVLDQQPDRVALSVVLWGYFLYAGVIDPFGGIWTLWPLFGTANQMLAAIALTLCTVVLFKMKRERYRAGDDCTGDLARGVHDGGRTGEGVQPRPECRIPQSRAQIRRRDRSRSVAGAGKIRRRR